MLRKLEIPRGPKGEKRPADVIGNAVKIMRIAAGEETEVLTDDGKNAAAVALGRTGGKARAAGMTAKKTKRDRQEASQNPLGQIAQSPAVVITIGRSAIAPRLVATLLP
jgi:hypothetical protein